MQKISGLVCANIVPRAKIEKMSIGYTQSVVVLFVPYYAYRCYVVPLIVWIGCSVVHAEIVLLNQIEVVVFEGYDASFAGAVGFGVVNDLVAKSFQSLHIRLVLVHLLRISSANNLAAHDVGGRGLYLVQNHLAPPVEPQHITCSPRKGVDGGVVIHKEVVGHDFDSWLGWIYAFGAAKPSSFMDT